MDASVKHEQARQHGLPSSWVSSMTSRAPVSWYSAAATTVHSSGCCLHSLAQRSPWSRQRFSWSRQRTCFHAFPFLQIHTQVSALVVVLPMLQLRAVEHCGCNRRRSVCRLRMSVPTPAMIMLRSNYWESGSMQEALTRPDRDGTREGGMADFHSPNADVASILMADCRMCACWALRVAFLWSRARQTP